jgi:hypothetical protein
MSYRDRREERLIPTKERQAKSRRDPVSQTDLARIQIRPIKGFQ